MEITEDLYQSIIKDLFERKPTGKLDFSVLKRVLEEYENPHTHYPHVHIAGTNGKGQVSVKTSYGLQLAGNRVGLFISPHLFTYEDRISINGTPISKEKVIQYYLDLDHLLSQLNIYLNFFECSTCMCFRHFSEEKVDVAVIETGLGGKFDATNVIHPLVSVITSVSLDHMEVLGETLEEIADQKAGIIKPFVPVVLGPRSQFQSIFHKAKEVSAPIHLVESQFDFYDLENQAVAKKTLEILSETFEIEENAIQQGLQKNMPCRFERKGNIIYDVAHNPDGFKRLQLALNYFYPHQTFRFLIGMSLNKDIRGSLEQIEEMAHFIHFVKGERETSASPESLGEIFSNFSDCSYSIEKSIEEGVINAKTALKEEEILVICGSFYIMSTATRASN